MAGSEEDIVRALTRAGTKGLAAAALAKAISAPAANKQLSSAITKLKSRGAIRGPFPHGMVQLVLPGRGQLTKTAIPASQLTIFLYSFAIFSTSTAAM